MTAHFDVKKKRELARSGVFETFDFVVREPDMRIATLRARRDKLITQIDEQLQLATNKNYAPVKYKWVSDVKGNFRRTAFPVKIRKWWLELLDGRVQISVFIKGKPIKLRGECNAIEVEDMSELVPTLELLRLSVELGDFDTLIHN